MGIRKIIKNLINNEATETENETNVPLLLNGL